MTTKTTNTKSQPKLENQKLILTALSERFPSVPVSLAIPCAERIISERVAKGKKANLAQSIESADLHFANNRITALIPAPPSNNQPATLELRQFEVDGLLLLWSMPDNEINIAKGLQILKRPNVAYVKADKLISKSNKVKK